jgi:VIT1/CCC1 family predicted Fe2+/Mn2+ transporter
MIAEVLPDRVAEAAQPEDLETLRRRLVELPAPPMRAAIDRQDILGALAVCLLVFASTFPVTVPFMIMHDALRATRVSNAIALVMLFLLGHSLARFTGARPWRMGLGMLLLGAILVAIIIALGG